MSYDYSLIERLSEIKKGLQKNIDLRDGIVATKSSISEDTYKKYFAEYSEKIKIAEDEISKCEKMIDEIKRDFEKRKKKIENEMISAEKSVDELKALRSSNAIDEKEYQKRKAENDDVIKNIEKENVALSKDEAEFKRSLRGGKKINALGKPNKSNIIFTAAALSLALVLIFVFSLIFKKYQTNEFGRSTNDYEKIYPVRVPVVDDSLRYGFTDETGIIVIPPQFDSVRDFSEGLSAVRLSGKWGYIDTLGNIVIDYRFSVQPLEFSDGLAAFVTNKKWGYIDTNGNIAIEPVYESAKSFYAELAPVKKAGKWGYINTKGEMVIAPKFNEAYRFSKDKVAVVRGADNKRGFIEIDGEYKIKPTYRDVKSFSQSLAPVMVSDKWGYINLENKITIPVSYQSADGFIDGYAAVKANNVCAVIDTNNVFYFSPTEYEVVYENMNNLGFGVFTMQFEKMWGLMKADGTEVVKPFAMSPISIYGNGKIFRAKTYYGYTLYDSSFAPIMNYYFRYAGIYKYFDNIQNMSHYFMLLYDEAKRMYIGGMLTLDENTYEIIFDKAKSIEVKAEKITAQFENRTSEIKFDAGMLVIDGNVYEKMNELQIESDKAELFNYSYSFLF